MRTRIRALRIAQGLSQHELAERAGLRQATISKAETRPDETDSDTLLKIAAGLSVPLADLFVTDPRDGALADLLKAAQQLDPGDRAALLKHAQALLASHAPQTP